MSGLSVGVAGLGLGRHFALALAKSPLVGRIEICDPDPDRRSKLRGECERIAADHAGLEEMLAAGRLDAVCVVTPDSMHRPHSERCFEAGCHVLQTKPLACTLPDADAIVRAAERAGRTLMVAHERRFRARTRAIRAILDAGGIGEIIHLRIDAFSDKREQFRRAPWYASEEAGRSAIVGTGIHEVDLLRHFAGRPVEAVSAFGNRLGALAFPRDKTTAAIFRFEGGAIGQVTVSFEARFPPRGKPSDSLQILGTKGMIADGRVFAEGQDGWAPLPDDARPLAAGVEGCVEAFVGAVSSGRPSPVSGRDAFESLAACVAADESAAAGKAVSPRCLA